MGFGIVQRLRHDFAPLNGVLARVASAVDDSDAVLFDELMGAAELALKLSTLAVLAGTLDDDNGLRQRQANRLARADSLGEWAGVLEELLLGPTSQQLQPQLRPEVVELTASAPEGTWQRELVAAINECTRRVKPDVSPIHNRVLGFVWTREFVALRNATKGHGAVTIGTKSELARILLDPLLALFEKSSMYQREWVHLHRNLSGKYRVSPLNRALGAPSFDYLKSCPDHNLEDGVYIFTDGPRRVELADSDVDISDFFVANGGFNGKRFELLSYATGVTKSSDASPYNYIPSSLPRSETSALSELLSIPGGHALANLPTPPAGYISRPQLELDLRAALVDYPSPVVTLFGRGGIGKTSLALSVLHALGFEELFDIIVWFSARDIDLEIGGPRPVEPDIRDHSDLAKELVDLFTPVEEEKPDFNPVSYFAQVLGKSVLSGPTLYVFDNFETVRDQAALYGWIYRHIRLPNRALITTRHREFNGDHAVEVTGMTFDESRLLIRRVAEDFGKESVLTEETTAAIYRESEGHPYVMKIVTGEVVTNGATAIRRTFARREDILQALFERTFARLSPTAKHAFLILCDWRSAAPEIALEAVLLKSSDERPDVQRAIEELHRSSFVELIPSRADETMFIRVPLSARLFGEGKLAVDPRRAAVRLDRELLEEFGAIQEADFRLGFQPRVDRFLKFIAREVEGSRAKLREYDDLLSFLGLRYPAAWRRISELYLELGKFEASKESILKYLQVESLENETRRSAWRLFEKLCKRDGDTQGEAHAIVEVSRLQDTWLPYIFHGIHRLNGLLAQNSPPQRNRAALASLGRELVEIAESRLDEATGDEGSRLAWLWLHLGESEKASSIVARFLKQEPDNYFCLKLADRLQLRLPKRSVR